MNISPLVKNIILNGVQRDIGHHGVFEEWKIVIGPSTGNVVIPVGANVGKPKGLREMVSIPRESLTVGKVEFVRRPRTQVIVLLFVDDDNDSSKNNQK